MKKREGGSIFLSFVIIVEELVHFFTNAIMFHLFCRLFYR